MLFTRALALNELQTASSRYWTQVAESIFYYDDNFVIDAPHHYMNECVCVLKSIYIILVSRVVRLSLKFFLRTNKSIFVGFYANYLLYNTFGKRSLNCFFK